MCAMHAVSTSELFGTFVSHPVDVAATVACSIISSRLDYYNSLFTLTGMSAANFTKLPHVQNNEHTRTSVAMPFQTRPYHSSSLPASLVTMTEGLFTKFWQTQSWCCMEQLFQKKIFCLLQVVGGKVPNHYCFTAILCLHRFSLIKGK